MGFLETVAKKKVSFIGAYSFYIIGLFGKGKRNVGETPCEARQHMGMSLSEAK